MDGLYGDDELEEQKKTSKRLLSIYINDPNCKCDFPLLKTY